MPSPRIFLFLVLTTLPGLGAEVKVNSAPELQQALRKAVPGTTIRIAPGDYAGGLSASGLRGEPGKPIIVEAADPKDIPQFRGGANAFHLSGAAHLELRNLALSGMSGNGLNIDDGGTDKPHSRHILLEGLKIRDIGPSGNNDGIKLSGVENFHILNCEFEDWGAGGSGIDMVGCHNGLVEQCHFTHAKSEKNNAVQAKGGSSRITIQACEFRNAGSRGVNLGGSTGRQFFRPPLDDGAEHVEAREITVQGCTFVGSGAPVAYVGVVNGIVRFNTIYHPDRWALRILQETNAPDFLPCREGQFTDNIVVFSSGKWASGGVNIGGGTAPETFQFARNWWYCEDTPARSEPRLPTREAHGEYGRDPQLRDPANGDLQLKPASPAAKLGAGGPYPKAPSPYRR